MGIFDWIILVFLLCCVIYGYRKGLVAALVQLAGLIMAFFLIGHYYPAVRYGLISKYDLNPILANITSFILVVIVLLVLIKIIIYIMDRIISMLHVTFINRLLGAIFWFLNALIFLVIMSIIIDFIPFFSNQLKNPSEHRVYNAVVVIKNDIYAKLELKAKEKLLELNSKRARQAENISIPIPTSK